MKRILAALSFVLASTAMAGNLGAKPSVVLVHGSFADGSCWSDVVDILQTRGLDVIAIQNPLTSLADDAAVAKRAIKDRGRPVVLVGHSWGGAVITEAGNEDGVAALVYVAAFAPDDGQSLQEAMAPYPTTPGLQHLKVGTDDFAYLTPEGYRDDFAQDLPAEKTRVLAAMQGPQPLSAFGSKVTKAAWRHKPAWYVVAEKDRMIDPNMQRAVAARMHATTTSLPTSHVPMMSRPQAVADVILSAVDAVTP